MGSTVGTRARLPRTLPRRRVGHSDEQAESLPVIVAGLSPEQFLELGIMARLCAAPDSAPTRQHRPRSGT